MVKKYELTADTITNESGKKLFRIRALTSFGDVEEGALGGYIEKEDNLNNVYGNAWVYDNARVEGDARVYDNACVYGKACVYTNVHIYGNAHVHGVASVGYNADICSDADVSDTPDYMVVKGIGTSSRTITFFKTATPGLISYAGIISYVSSSYFSGSLEELEERIKGIYGDSKDAKEYLAMIAVVKIHFEGSGEK